MEPRRFRRLSRSAVMGIQVPVAEGPIARLLGLALLDSDRVGAGLLIPRCRCVHTFGMRFALDLVFLDTAYRPLREVRGVRPFRFARCPNAVAVLERPCPGASRRGRSGVGEFDTEQEESMNLIDKLTGRAKKAAGDLADDASLRREGRKEERKGDAKEERDRAADAAAEKSEEVADLERKT
jgi:uncharacterized protein YjbJ (UPF0337 family)/uncharacterized membrane protein (UPF0127 family)